MKEYTEGDEIPGTREIQYIITHQLHNEMEGHLVKLSHLLEEDKEFFKFITSQLLLIGQEFDVHTVYQSINAHYRNTMEQDVLRSEVRGIIYHIAQILFGTSEIYDKIGQLPLEDQEEVHSIACDEIKDEIRSILGSLDYCDV